MQVTTGVHQRCDKDFGGTSAAAAIVSGTIALTLQAK